jgi:hypothetical protein
MSIACLAWGSLFWDPKELPLAGSWHLDGPSLPLEFARISSDGRLTLVLIEEATRLVPTAWSVLSVPSIEEAAESLRRREGPTRDEWIGRCSARHECRPEIRAWAEAKGLTGVVWAALPPKWKGVDGRAPSLEEAVGYLDKLAGEPRRLAENYVRRAPSFVRTPYRDAFEDQLGWVERPSEDSASLA